MASDILAPVLINALIMSIIYMLMASGLTLVFGVLHLINFAHGELYMLGGYGLWLLSQVLGVNYFLSLFLAMTGTAIMGVIIDRSFFIHLRGQILESFILALGISLLLQGFALLVFGSEERGIKASITDRVNIFGVSVLAERIIAVIAGIGVMIAMMWFVHRTRLGQAMLATEQNREAAALQGINVNNMCSLAMAVGGALAGLGGGLISTMMFVTPGVGTIPLMKAFIIIIIGGLGNIPGAVLGGIVIGFIDCMGAIFLGGPLAYLIGFVFIMVLLIFRPKGFFGHDVS